MLDCFISIIKHIPVSLCAVCNSLEVKAGTEDGDKPENEETPKKQIKNRKNIE